MKRGNPLMGAGEKRFLSLVDIVLFALDARIPRSSTTVARKYLKPGRFIYVLTRTDLADPEATRAWLLSLTTEGRPAFAVQANTGEGMGELVAFLESERERVNRRKAIGALERPLRLMVFGLPNVGKSSIINRLTGRAKAPAGERPGLTRGVHWIRCGERFLMLDTPGVLEPGRVKGETLMALAATGAVPETRYDSLEVALWLLKKTSTAFESAHDERTVLLALEEFGRGAGQVKKGGEVDLTRASQLYLARFRRGELGRFTLELPD